MSMQLSSVIRKDWKKLSSEIRNIRLSKAKCGSNFVSENERNIIATTCCNNMSHFFFDISSFCGL